MCIDRTIILEIAILALAQTAIQLSVIADNIFNVPMNWETCYSLKLPSLDLQLSKRKLVCVHFY